MARMKLRALLACPRLKTTHKYPDYPFFPFIDAVATFRSGSDKPDEILAYIQVTIRSEKNFKEDKFRSNLDSSHVIANWSGHFKF